MVRLAADMVAAVVNPDDPEANLAVDIMAGIELAPMSGNGAKSGRRNAPATNDDPDLFETFDDVITADELPEAFR